MLMSVLPIRKFFQDENPMYKDRLKTAKTCFKPCRGVVPFPFFATKFPCALDLKSGGLLPRFMVDGFFSVSRDRFGCPEFLDAQVDRTIAISTFPKEIIGIDAFDDKDCISPPAELMQDLFRIATQASSREHLTMVYEQGIMDAQAWYQQEVSAEKRCAQVAREQARSLH